ncbi:MAG: hypothetical protein A2599_03280 [Candidatus Staskawiczbacteria bacterium RIFOXYD1_FULL_39_28]|nr:MAG: hypothetical protein A2599_03280 [Candidatus Staskawiczbacteria bacterium RIFOXYD1_FULL_39_28]
MKLAAKHMKIASKKIKNTKKQCSLCSAEFEVWLNNVKTSEDRKEKISQHFLSYCPVCTRQDGKVK